jgi:hypothetical protein
MEPPRSLEREGSSMHTIMLLHTVASLLAVHRLGNIRPLAGESSVTKSVGSIGTAFVLIVVLFFAMMASAARGMADLIAGFLRVAASMSRLLFVIVIVLAVVLLLHR